MSQLQYTLEDGIATILFNRPERRNAFTFAMARDYSRMLLEADQDDRVRVVVVTGAGSAFCSGIDLKSVAATKLSPWGWKELFAETLQKIPLILDAMDKPILAAVNGTTLGLGLDIALMCDMRYAARSAILASRYIDLGLVPGNGTCHYLPRLVSNGMALELLLTGRSVDSEEAKALGMVNRVVDDDQLLEEVNEVAGQIASKSAAAVTLTKRALRESLRLDLRTSLDLTSSYVALIRTSDEATNKPESMRTS